VIPGVEGSGGRGGGERVEGEATTWEVKEGGSRGGGRGGGEREGVGWGGEEGWERLYVWIGQERGGGGLEVWGREWVSEGWGEGSRWGGELKLGVVF